MAVHLPVKLTLQVSIYLKGEELKIAVFTPSPKGRGKPSVLPWMNGPQNVVHTYSGILVSLRKEGDSGTCDNV